MNKIIVLKLGEQKWTKRDRCLILSTFIMKEKRKLIKSRIRIWHGTCNIKDDQENRRAGHVKNN